MCVCVCVCVWGGGGGGGGGGVYKLKLLTTIPMGRSARIGIARCHSQDLLHRWSEKHRWRS